MKATAIIADDEIHLAEYLNDRLTQLWPELDIVGIAKNGPEALKLIDDESPGVAFLDIRMPGLTGLEVAKRIDQRTHVVFVTAYDQYAVDAFDNEAADYLLKPVADERLVKTIEKLKKRLAGGESPAAVGELLTRLAGAMPKTAQPWLRWIRASVGEVVRQIPVEEVLFFQAQDKYVVVMTLEGESLIRTGISELAAQLNPDEFWQIHRSTIVNVNAISATRKDFNGHTVVKLKQHKQELPVSRAYAHLFKQM
ncbi:MAG: LytTR family DNA-binding domain-containing protein [Burkholderiales bacterium]|nr:LytTR family DNA-binding domain-containing protein [Burkholderiales bacterium]